MYFFLAGGIAALIMYCTLALEGCFWRTRLCLAAASFMVFGLFGWLSMPVLNFWFLEIWLTLLAVGAITSLWHWLFRDDYAAAADNMFAGRIWYWPMLAVGLLVFVLAPATTWSLFRAQDYHQLLGEPAVSEFGADVSPVAIDRVRRVDQPLAYNLGSKRIEAQPGLGSRVRLDDMNIQTLNGCFLTQDGEGEDARLCFENDLVWVAPLRHAGFFKWLANRTTPGYILVSATDQSKVHMVTAVADAAGEAPKPFALRYLYKGGYWGDYVKRHLRTNGYAGVGLTDYTFELDNRGRPFWVVTVYDHFIGFSGADATGVLTVDVQTGEFHEYSIEDAPTWIDRIQPEELVNDQLDYWGEFVHGYWNTWFAKRDIVQPTDRMSLVYGSDDRAYWYSGLQSAGSDTATNSFVLVDTRTKQIRRYMIPGANEVAARTSAENAPGVREAGYEGSAPILYNVSGTPTYFLTLRGEDKLVKMYAFVSVTNYEVVGVGNNTGAALRDYQNAIIRTGRDISLSDIDSQVVLEAVVADATRIGDTFYLLLRGHDDFEIYGTIDVSPELKWAKTGHAVTVTIPQDGTNSRQLYAFDIVNLAISTPSPTDAPTPVDGGVQESVGAPDLVGDG